MRVETREPSGSDVRATIDPQLDAGVVRRTETELRIGPPARLDADGRRTAAALAARALRPEGGVIAWRAEDPEQVRAIIEGTAYGAYDPGLFKGSYASRPELTLALDAPPELHALVARQETVMRHLDTARDLANRPPNDLTPVALAAHAKSHALPHVTVESHGRDWIEAQEMGAFAAVASGSGEDPQLIVMRY